MSETKAAFASLLSSVEVYDSRGSWSPLDSERLLKQAVSNGWHRVGLPESLGGHGGDLQDAAEITRAAVGSPSPLADVVIGSAHLLELADLRLPDAADVVVVAVPQSVYVDGSHLTALASRVPWARSASHLLVPAPAGRSSLVALVGIEDVAVTPGSNLAGEPRDTVAISTLLRNVVQVPLAYESLIAEIRLRGALTRSVQISQALRRLVEITARHVIEREQFGRSLSAFQAVQQQIAELAAEASAVEAVTRLAVAETFARSQESARLIACAKVRSGIGAGVGARIAHQLHGAVGISQEHQLHRFTRALWSWRDEFGSENEWALTIADEVTKGANAWLWLAGG